MNIPEKIEPERLKDTLIEIRYKSEVPFEYRLGLCHSVLMKLNLNPSKPFNAHTIELDPSNLLMFDTPKNIFENETLRLKVSDDRLVFNSNGVYQGWSEFSRSVQHILAKLMEESLLGKFYWIGLRYVSEFENIQIFDKLIWDFQYIWQDKKNINTIFRTEWMEEQDRIIVNLLDNAQRENDYYSIMDIDVNCVLNESEIYPLESVFEHLNRLHTKEKSVFFGLMKPDFLASLNPSY
jgi:uncharacterized protein (TIGR04255 family)